MVNFLAVAESIVLYAVGLIFLTLGVGGIVLLGFKIPVLIVLLVSLSIFGLLYLRFKLGFDKKEKPAKPKKEVFWGRGE